MHSIFRILIKGMDKMKREGYQEMEEDKMNLLEDHKQCDINDQHEEDKSWDKRTFASTFETFWNICNTIQGLPILVIPYAVRNGGYLAILTLLLVAAASNYTGKTIVRCLYETDPKSGKRKRVRDSYADIGDAFLPNLGGHLVLVTQFIELLFVAGVYPLLVGRVLAKSFPHVTVPCWLWSLIGGILFFPNIFLENLSQVAWTSILTVLSAKVIFVTVVAHSVLHLQKWEISSLENFHARTYPSALGVLVTSYLSQPFVSLIEGNMRYKEKFNSVMNLSYVAMTLLNVTIGVVAYIIFEGETAEVITNNLPEGSFRVVVNVMAAVMSVTSYTLPMFTIFEIIENSSLFFLPGSFGKSIFTPSVIVFRMLMVCMSVIFAASFPSYSYILALVGSIAGISLEFILPLLFHMKMYFQDMTWCNIVADGVVVVVGVIVMVTGTISSVFSLIQVYSQSGNDECA